MSSFRAFVLTLTIILAVSDLASAKAGSKPNNPLGLTSSLDFSLKARPEIRLRKNRNFGIYVSGKTPAGLSLGGKLVSIDGITLKGKSLDEIEDLLFGPLDTKVELSYLKRGVVLKERLSRLPQTRYGVWKESQGRYFFRNLQDDSSVEWSTGVRSNYDSFLSSNLDLIFKAYRNLEIRRLDSLPDPKECTVFATASAALLGSDRIGDLSAADNYLDLILRNPKFNDLLLRRRDSSPLKLVKHLAVTGRSKQAMSLCRGWLNIIDSGAAEGRLAWQKAVDVWKLRRAFLEFQSNSDDRAGAKKSLDLLFESKGLFLTHRLYSKEIVWLGDALKQAGENQKSLLCFQSLKPFELLKRHGSDRLGLDVVGEVSFLALRIARMQNKTGHRAEAIATLKKLLAIFDNSVDKEKQYLAEKIPRYSPARSEIELALAEQLIDNGEAANAIVQARAAVGRIEKVLGKNASQLKRPLETLARALHKTGSRKDANSCLQRATRLRKSEVYRSCSYEDKYTLHKAALTAIRANDIETSRQHIRKLICAYDREKPIYQYYRKSFGLFCALLEISRKLADSKRFDEAEQLLELLEKAAHQRELTPVVAPFLRVEKAICNQLRGNSSAWSLVDEDNCLVQPPNHFRRLHQKELSSEHLDVLCIQENMRRLAGLYSAAGYPNRASILIERALDVWRSNSKLTKDSTSLDMIEANAMLFHELSVIRARQGRTDQAVKFALDAIALCDNLNWDDRNDREFYSGRIYKTVQLVEVLCRSAHKGKALVVLNALAPKLRTITRAEVGKWDSRDRSYGYVLLRQNSRINAYRAKLFFSAGKIEEARQLIATAIDEAYNNVPFQYYMLGARIAQTANDDDLCARYFAEAAKGCDYPSAVSIGRHQPGFKQNLLEKAIAHGEKSASLDPQKLAGMYVALAGQLRRQRGNKNTQKILKYYEKARDLIPDSDPSKVRLLSKISLLKPRVREKKEKEERSRAPTSKNNSETEQKRRIVEHARSQLEASISAARLAERHNPASASSRWLRVAELESRAMMPDRALEHARHGISLFEYRPDLLLRFRAMLGYSLVDNLSKQGREKDAEALMKLAIQKVKDTSGPESPATAAQLSRYVSFLVQQNRDAESLKVVDQIMKMGMRRIEIGPIYGNALSILKTMAEQLPKKRKGLLAEEILLKILDAQKKELDQDDMRICNSLASLCKVYTADKRYKEAQKTLDAAYKIKQLYVGKERAVAELAPYSIPLYTKLNKTEKLKQINTTVRNRFRLKPNIIDPQFFRENKKIALLYQRWNEKPIVEEMRAEYQQARKQAPYSARCIGALYALLEYGCAHKNWQLVAEMIPHRIEILKRMPSPNAGRQTGCVPSRFPRIKAYTLAIQSSLELDKKSKAKYWLKRAAAELPELAAHEKLQLAKLEEDCGNHEMAIHYVKEAESSLDDRNTWLYQRVAAVWLKLGNRKRAKDLRIRGEQARLRQKEIYRKLRNSPLKGI